MTLPLSRVHSYWRGSLIQDLPALGKKYGIDTDWTSFADDWRGLYQLQMGRVHEERVGPHPQWSCQLAFSSEVFETLIPWLDSERKGLDVFVHGLTGNDIEDHTTHASWLGAPSAS